MTVACCSVSPFTQLSARETDSILRRGDAVVDRARILYDYVQKLVATGHPEAIVLFGSEVGNRANDDSDFDFLVIERNAGHRRQRGIQYQMALRPRVIAIDILVRTPEEIQQAIAEGNPLIKEILQTGRWVYGEPRFFGPT